MGHLLVAMLPEAQELGLDANADQEEVNAADKVTNGLVVDHAIRHSVTELPHNQHSLVIVPLLALVRFTFLWLWRSRKQLQIQ